MTLKQLTERDCREWKLSAIYLLDRHTWISGERSACSKPLPGRGPTDVDVPLYLHVNQKSDDDDDDDGHGGHLVQMYETILTYCQYPFDRRPI